MRMLTSESLRRMFRRAAYLTILFSFWGCSAPSVNLSTPEPIKVDISMRLDVYQHEKTTAKKSSIPEDSPDSETRRRNRMADIQQFKNARIVGEGHDGLLSIRVDTPGDYGDYIRKIVAEENSDRMALMKAIAEKEKTSLPEIQKRQAELWRNSAFQGELIEVLGPDGSWIWVKKGT